MFDETDYIAQVRDATRWLNDTLARAKTAGLTISVKVSAGQPVIVTVEVQPR